MLATAKVNPNLDTNLKGIVGHTLWLAQLQAIGVTLCLAVVGTIVIAYVVKALVGLRVSDEVEVTGLDVTEHGEEGYHGGIGGGVASGHYGESASFLSAMTAVDDALKTPKAKRPQTT